MMDRFDIDLYLWHHEIGHWMFVPPADACALAWSGRFLRREFIGFDLGLTFRWNHHFWLGGARDPLSMILAVTELERSLEGDFEVSVTPTCRLWATQRGHEVVLSRESDDDSPEEYAVGTAAPEQLDLAVASFSPCSLAAEPCGMLRAPGGVRSLRRGARVCARHAAHEGPSPCSES